MAQLIKNAIETPDGTILHSRGRHDYVEHKDELTGKTYFTDGGLAYQRRSANGDEIDRCVWDDDTFDVVRQNVEWGSRGEDGKQELKFIRLCDMETDHIINVLNNVKFIAPQFKDAMLMELEYRAVYEW